jgi:hypothetical protein
LTVMLARWDSAGHFKGPYTYPKHDLESCGRLLTGLAYATTDVVSLVEWVEKSSAATLIKYIYQNTIASALLILCQVLFVPSDMKP